MNKFKQLLSNTKTKVKILSLESVVCILMAIVVWVGIVGLSKATENTHYLINTVEARKTLTLEMNEYASCLRADYNKMVVFSEVYHDIDTVKSSFPSEFETFTKYEEAIKKYRELMDNDEEITEEKRSSFLAEINEIESTVTKWKALYEKVYESCISDNFDAIYDEMQAFFPSINSLDQHLITLIKATEDREVEIATENEHNAKQTLILIIVLFFIILVVVSCFALLIAGEIANPIVKLAKASLKIAEGEMDINVSSNAKDEVGELSNNFTLLVDTFKALLNEMEDTFDKVMIDGDIDARVDESKYNGEYKVIAGKINHMLVNYVEDIRGCRNMAEAYASGNFEETCKRYPGKKAVLHERFDLLQYNLKEVGLTIATFIEGIKKGDLSVHADADKFEGTWKVIIQDLNELMERVNEPIKETEVALTEINKGNLRIDIDPNRFEGQFKDMILTIQDTAKNLSNYINEIADVLQSMANQNLDVEIKQNYLGDFGPIKTALHLIVDNFNHLIKEIIVSSDQVAIGSQSIADSSTALAQGASEQASAIEELTATMSTISENTHKNMENVLKSSKLANEAKESAEQVRSEMRELLNAMKEISEASNNISNIIKAIDDIAFQTNILSLNAAVEAARAGEHGKGFAVVAEEVRNLAARSQQSAKETADLIEASLEKAKQGSEIVDRTADSIKKIAAQIEDIAAVSEDIATDSKEQDKSIGEINIGINQIATVVSNNTATSEESAAASEELASQSAVFKESVSKFTLKD